MSLICFLQTACKMKTYKMKINFPLHYLVFQLKISTDMNFTLIHLRIVPRYEKNSICGQLVSFNK